ncbi:MAG: hypothetical protein ACXAD7_17785, partial [Candidatus Kariarchaeaceae archaeon]
GTTLWPELAVGYDKSLEPYEYNLETAKELLEMAGYDPEDAISASEMKVIKKYRANWFELTGFYFLLLLVVNHLRYIEPGAAISRSRY